jgi:hypothetical protein
VNQASCRRRPLAQIDPLEISIMHQRLPTGQVSTNKRAVSKSPRLASTAEQGPQTARSTDSTVHRQHSPQKAQSTDSTVHRQQQCPQIARSTDSRVSKQQFSTAASTDCRVSKQPFSTAATYRAIVRHAHRRRSVACAEGPRRLRPEPRAHKAADGVRVRRGLGKGSADNRRGFCR